MLWLAQARCFSLALTYSLFLTHSHSLFPTRCFSLALSLQLNALLCLCLIRLQKFSRMRIHYISKTATAGPDADSVLMSRALRAGPERMVASISASAVASCGLNYWGRKRAVRRVLHCKEVGLQERPLTVRATVPRVPYGIGPRMSLQQRTTLSKSFRTTTAALESWEQLLVDLFTSFFCFLPLKIA